MKKPIILILLMIFFYGCENNYEMSSEDLRNIIAFSTGETRQDLVDEIVMQQFKKLSKEKQHKFGCEHPFEYLVKTKFKTLNTQAQITQEELTEFAEQQRNLFGKRFK